MNAHRCGASLRESLARAVALQRNVDSRIIETTDANLDFRRSSAINDQAFTFA